MMKPNELVIFMVASGSVFSNLDPSTIYLHRPQDLSQNELFIIFCANKRSRRTWIDRTDAAEYATDDGSIEQRALKTNRANDW